ncbi:MAG: GTPase, partial [candidate division WOR-3 bacterium]|nr:GTPase [candidate division WOR-3 bacterium]
MEKQKTVFAQITPPGISAVASLRISGSGTVPLLTKISGLDPEHRKVYVRKLRYNGHVLDRAVIIFFRNPRSYTGEDMAEISVHGGIASIRRLKNILLDLGIHRAEPGEFTKRAFLNSKMDLIQAESILSITNARTVEELDRAVEVSEGRLSRSISKIREDIIYIKSYLDGSIDFPDDIEYQPDHILNLFGKLRKYITDIYEDSRNGLLMSDGVDILITGLSNTGKSTLFNRLIREDRAIIT